MDIDIKGYITKKNLLYLTFVISLISLLGSLYFSEILLFPACDLCWYQRIVMYPIVPITVVAIINRDFGVFKYILPLSILGMIMAFYHVLLQEGIIAEDLSRCTSGIPCTSEYLRLLGIITIPLMSFLSFTSINILMFLLRSGNLKD